MKNAAARRRAAQAAEAEAKEAAGGAVQLSSVEGGRPARRRRSAIVFLATTATALTVLGIWAFRAQERLESRVSEPSSIVVPASMPGAAPGGGAWDFDREALRRELKYALENPSDPAVWVHDVAGEPRTVPVIVYGTVTEDEATRAGLTVRTRFSDSVFTAMIDASGVDAFVELPGIALAVPQRQLP